MEPEAALPWYRRWAWILVLVLAGLLALFGVFVLFSPVDASDFETETGVAWTAFSAAEPEAASYLEREARLLASITLGFGLLVAGLAGTLLRGGNRTAWALAWILPATLGLAAVVFLASGAATLGWSYVVATAVAAIGVGFAPRST
jgi:uncharacterized membrane protein HdeD (DUF308 family)